jgi:hypothetical protein
MVKHRNIGAAAHAGAQIISLPLANPEDLSVGQLISIQQGRLTLASPASPVLGVLTAKATTHVSIGVAGIFTVLGSGEQGQYLVGNRAFVIESFQSLDTSGALVDAAMVLL